MSGETSLTYAEALVFMEIWNEPAVEELVPYFNRTEDVSTRIVLHDLGVFLLDFMPVPALQVTQEILGGTWGIWPPAILSILNKLRLGLKEVIEKIERIRSLEAPGT